MMAVGSAHAIGLGEIYIHSALGHPLQASIALLDEKNLSADCITLQAPRSYGLPMPSNLKFEIKEAAGKPPKLWLSTSQAMHEPAMGITVVLKCEGELQREYAILLDISPPVTREEAITTPTLSNTGSVQTIPARVTAPRSTGLMDKKRRPETLPDARPDQSPASPKPRKSGLHSDEPRPRLTLSGARLLRVDPELGLPLKLDLSLPDPLRIPEKPLTKAERQDDNTALTHKLVHLEQQLATLQKRNEELSRRVQLQTTQPVPAESPFSALPEWVYLLAGGLLLSGGIAWLLYRRKPLASDFGDEEEDYIITPPANHEPPFNTDFTTQLSADIQERWSSVQQPIKSARPSHSVEQEAINKEVTFDSDSKPPESNSLDFQASDKTPSSDSPVQNESKELDEWAGAYLVSGDAELNEKLEDVVEVCLAHGNADMAIQLLEQNIQKTPSASPAPWLTLLDLLERAGETARYEQTRTAFRHLFNISVPGPNQIQLAQGHAGLESYPHVMSELLRLWPTGTAATYLDALLCDTRGGTRSGFDLNTYRDISLLRAIQQLQAA